MDPKKKKKVYFPDRQKKTTKSGFTYLQDTGQPLHTGHNIPKPGKKAEKEFLRSQGGTDKREVQIPGYHETHAAVGEAEIRGAELTEKSLGSEDLVLAKRAEDYVVVPHKSAKKGILPKSRENRKKEKSEEKAKKGRDMLIEAGREGAAAAVNEEFYNQARGTGGASVDSLSPPAPSRKEKGCVTCGGRRRKSRRRRKSKRKRKRKRKSRRRRRRRRRTRRR